MNWIKVEDELPEEDESVIVWALGDWHCAVYERAPFSEVTRRMHFYIPESVYATQAGSEDVTHWVRVDPPT